MEVCLKRTVTVQTAAIGFLVLTTAADQTLQIEPPINNNDQKQTNNDCVCVLLVSVQEEAKPDSCVKLDCVEPIASVFVITVKQTNK